MDVSMLDTIRHLFTPHHTNNHRPKIIHPKGMALMIGVILLSSSSVEILREYQPEGIVLGYASNISASEVLNQTNQQRIDSNLPPLIMSQKLNQAAAAKAADMFTQDYWAHISPSGVPPWTFIKNSGYSYSVAGENLARDFDSTGPMVDAWMASPTHRANIVHTKYTETGIAVVNGNLQGIDTTLVVQMFGRPVQPIVSTDDTQAPPAQISPEAAVENQLDDQVDQADMLAPVTDTETEIISEHESEYVYAPSQAVLSQTQATRLDPTENPIYLSPLDIKKSAVLAVIFLIMTVLILDEIIIRHRQTVRFVGRNVAHVSFLLLTLLIVWNVIQPGTIQ